MCQVGLECLQEGRLTSKFGPDQLGPGCWEGGDGDVRGTELSGYGIWFLFPFSGQWKTAEPSLLCSPGVFGCSLKHSQLLWEAGLSLWGALPAVFCLLSDPSKPCFVPLLLVPLLPGLRLGCTHLPLVGLCTTT